MIVEEIFIFLAGAILGAGLAWMYVHWVAARVLSRLRAELQNMEAEENSEEVIETRVEMVNETFYIYRIDNGEFVGQGQTLEELKNRILEKFKNSNTNVKITQGETDVLKKLKEQL